MDSLTRTAIASALRNAADGTIPEEEFYKQFRVWQEANREDDLMMITSEEIEHYWGFLNHTRNIFGFRVRPKNILKAYRERLRILAKAYEEEWDPERAQREVDEW
jgi:hypothetical protein